MIYTLNIRRITEITEFPYCLALVERAGGAGSGGRLCIALALRVCRIARWVIYAIGFHRTGSAARTAADERLLVVFGAGGE